jgi:hypothetical protein
MKLNDCKYDKIKLLYEFSKVAHFIEKHAESDSKKANDPEFNKFLDEIEAQLEKYIEQLNKMICA